MLTLSKPLYVSNNTYFVKMGKFLSLGELLARCSQIIGSFSTDLACVALKFTI